MDAPYLATEILVTLWDLGRIFICMAVQIAVWGAVLSLRRGDGGKSYTQRGLIVLGTVGIGSLYLFLNLEATHGVALMHAEPAWGALMILTSSTCLVAAGLSTYRHVAVNRPAKPPSILDTAEPQIPTISKISTGEIWCVPILLAGVAILWLWKISRAIGPAVSRHTHRRPSRPRALLLTFR